MSVVILWTMTGCPVLPRFETTVWPDTMRLGGTYKQNKLICGHLLSTHARTPRKHSTQKAVVTLFSWKGRFILDLRWSLKRISAVILANYAWLFFPKIIVGKRTWYSARGWQLSVDEFTLFTLITQSRSIWLPWRFKCWKDSPEEFVRWPHTFYNFLDYFGPASNRPFREMKESWLFWVLLSHCDASALRYGW